MQRHDVASTLRRRCKKRHVPAGFESVFNFTNLGLKFYSSIDMSRCKTIHAITDNFLLYFACNRQNTVGK